MMGGDRPLSPCFRRVCKLPEIDRGGVIARRRPARRSAQHPRTRHLERKMGKEILCGFSVDVDAVAGWLGSYGGEDSPADISRGIFAGEVGSLRLIKLFERFGIRTTWFIP